MILVNESARDKNTIRPFKKNSIIAINTTIANDNKCSWICHNNTRYCLDYHVKSSVLKSSIVYNIYFGMIYGLKATGDYAAANIIFLVVLWPLLMYILVVKILLLNHNKKSKNV